MFNEGAKMSQVSIKYLNLCLEDKTQYRKKMEWIGTREIHGTLSLSVSITIHL